MKRAWNLVEDGVRALRIAALALPVAAAGPATGAAQPAAGTATPAPPAEMPAAPTAAPWTAGAWTAGPEEDACRERCVAPEGVQTGETPAVGVAPDTTGSGCHHADAPPR